MNSKKVCKTDNEMELYFDAISVNESLARVAVAAFVTEKNPTLEELSDIKTAVSEAVTNAIIHGYGNDGRKKKADESSVYIEDETEEKVRPRVISVCVWAGLFVLAVLNMGQVSTFLYFNF